MRSYTTLIASLCYKTVVSHIVHVCEQVALLLVALCKRDSVQHAQRLQQIAPLQVIVELMLYVCGSLGNCQLLGNYIDDCLLRESN